MNHAEFNAKFLVVGGGSGGVTVASTLTKKFGTGTVWIVEPSEVKVEITLQLLCQNLG